MKNKDSFQERKIKTGLTYNGKRNAEEFSPATCNTDIIFAHGQRAPVLAKQEKGPDASCIAYSY
jgi:hypothetical protein